MNIQWQLEKRALEAETQRLSKLYRASLELLVEQEKLLGRAAEALEKHLPGRLGNKFDHPDYILIDDLRKAAQ